MVSQLIPSMFEAADQSVCLAFGPHTIMSSVVGIILRLGALLSLPVGRAGRVLLHPRGLLFCADVLVPKPGAISGSRRSNGRCFTSLWELFARVRSLVVGDSAPSRVAAEADGPVNSWQLNSAIADGRRSAA